MELAVLVSQDHKEQEVLLDHVVSKVPKVDLDRRGRLAHLGREDNLAQLDRLDKLERLANAESKDHRDQRDNVVNLVLKDKEENQDHEEKLVRFQKATIRATTGN